MEKNKLFTRIYTAEDFERRMVVLHPKAVILHALGGYRAGMEGKAGEVDKALARYLLNNRLIIMPSRDGELRFVPMDTALRTEENGK